MSDNSTATATATAAAQTPAPSTLIEFPGTSRASRPQWRKDLSERVREIQQRRAREAAENEMNFAPQPSLPEPPQAHHAAAPRHQDDDDAPAPSLGLVPTRNDAPPMNPLVVAALRRIERARQPVASPNATSKSRASSGGAATAAAVAYVAEEQYQTALETAPVEMPPAPSLGVAATEAASAPETSKTEAKTEARSAQATEAARPSSLVVVTTPPSAKTEATVEAQKVETAPEATTAPAVKTGARMVANPAQVELKIEAGHAAAARAGAQTKPRRVIPGVLDEFSLERREAQITDAANCVPVVERENDHAPRGSRFVAGVTDLLLVSLCAMPFAAIIELTSGRWSDPRVMGSMTGIVLLVMFLYFVVSTGLVGRTPAMWLFSLRAVDARSALVPTTGQSMRRTLLYMLSLATLGLGIIYALFDAEGRTVHDHLSGTIVVRE